MSTYGEDITRGAAIREIRARYPFAKKDALKRLTCTTCGKPVSTLVPEATVVRAYIECPECIEKTR